MGPVIFPLIDANLKELGIGLKKLENETIVSH